MYYECLKKLIRLAFQIPCLFHEITGLYCVGCGGTRAVKYLLKGEILTSIQYHPLVLYTAVVFSLELISWTAAKQLKRPGMYLGHGKVFLGLGIFIAVVNCVVKNVFLIAFDVDLLSVPLL